MISLPLAILIGSVLLGIGCAAAVIGAFYFAYKMMLTATVFRASETPEQAALVLKGMKKEPVQPQQTERDPEMPDMEIASLMESEAAIKNMRKQQEDHSKRNY